MIPGCYELNDVSERTHCASVSKRKRSSAVSTNGAQNPGKTNIKAENFKVEKKYEIIAPVNSDITDTFNRKISAPSIHQNYLQLDSILASQYRYV